MEVSFRKEKDEYKANLMLLEWDFIVHWALLVKGK